MWESRKYESICAGMGAASIPLPVTCLQMDRAQGVVLECRIEGRTKRRCKRSRAENKNGVGVWESKSSSCWFGRKRTLKSVTPLTSGESRSLLDKAANKAIGDIRNKNGPGAPREPFYTLVDKTLSARGMFHKEVETLHHQVRFALLLLKSPTHRCYRGLTSGCWVAGERGGDRKGCLYFLNTSFEIQDTEFNLI